MLTHISHITLFVNNQDESLKFYQTLGFEVHTDADFGNMRWLTICLPSNKNLELALMLPEDKTEEALVGKQAAQKPLFSLATNNCKEDFVRLQGLGVPFVQEPKEEPWGISAMAKDPNGNMIYMVQESH